MQAPKTRAEEITIERIMGWIPQYFQADAFSSETVRQGRELRLFQAAAVRRRRTVSRTMQNFALLAVGALAS